jgi:hypothetical protein
MPAGPKSFSRPRSSPDRAPEAERGIAVAAFGDLFLEDIRRYREAKLSATGLRPISPIWGIPTNDLAREMIAGGLRARLTCVDPKQLPPAFAGREFDSALLEELPPFVDVCALGAHPRTASWPPLPSRQAACRQGPINAAYPANVRTSFAIAAGRPRMRIATPSSPYSSATTRAFS